MGKVLNYPYFNNGIMLHPDTNEMMCRVSARRMNWYLKRGLAEKIDDKTIRLLFVPQGHGQTDDYFLQVFENKCVVCGITENLNMHHIFPNCYRKYFAKRIGCKAGHDMVLMCDPHHQEYEKASWPIKLQLGKKYNVPMCGQGGRRNEKEREVYSAASALLRYGHRIPEHKKAEIWAVVKTYLDISSPSLKDCKDILKEIDSRTKTGQSYGEMLAARIENLHEFMVFWRKHFVETMKPQHMPPNWDINKCLIDYK